MVECEYAASATIIEAAAVLIDTWWNVNVQPFWGLSLALPGFNRYMVECESVIAAAATQAVEGFNRYMVECEFFMYRHEIFTRRVLIDTWWNVNRILILFSQSDY